MKARIIRSTLQLGAILTLSTGLAGPAAIAGPGLDYWRNLGQAGKPASNVNPALVADAACPCTDPRVVTIMETKPLFPNGRGPTRTVEVGRKFVCTTCDSPMTAMKPSGNNGRGAMAKATIAGVHDCAGCASGQPGTVVN